MTRESTLEGSIIERLAFLEKVKKEHEEDLKRVRAEIAVKTKNLQEQLANGATTGDRLWDLVIREFGINDEMLKKYRALEQKLAGKKGEFVLLFCITEGKKPPIVPYMFTMVSHEDRSTTWYRLGVLDGEELIWFEREASFFDSHISLPVSRYIHGEIHIFIDAIDLKYPLLVQKENIFAQYATLLLHRKEQPIIIGDEAVKGWLEKHLMQGLYKPAADALSKLVLELTD